MPVMLFPSSPGSFVYLLSRSHCVGVFLVGFQEFSCTLGPLLDARFVSIFFESVACLSVFFFFLTVSFEENRCLS